MEVSEIIAYNFRKIREERNLSMGQLAEQAGISKVVLSQIEKGDSNPTINTLWKVADALNMPLSSLIELPELQAVHVKKKELVGMSEDKYHMFNYYVKNQNRSFEVYLVEMEPGCEHVAQGHSANVVEYIIVHQGTAVMEVNGVRYVLETDDSMYFDASVPHTYINETDEQVKLSSIIYYT